MRLLAWYTLLSVSLLAQDASDLAGLKLRAVGRR